MGAQNSDQAKREVAKRYARWVLSEMISRDWDQVRLADEAGLSKQDISALVHAKRLQPTAHQVTALARAFEMEPTDVLAAIGLWEGESSDLPPLTAYLRRASGLQEDQIAAVRRTVQAFQAERELRVLREQQESYGSNDVDLRDKGDGTEEVDILPGIEPEAAYREPDEEGDASEPD